MKKILALVLAMMMLFVGIAAYAEDQVPANDPAPAASSLPTAEISITNLEEGDAVNLYKIVKWDSAASDWAFDGITVEGYATVEALVTALNGNDAPAAMTALAAAIASKEVEDDTAPVEGTYTYEAEVGLYFALVTTGTANVYNPMVLSVNFEDPDTGAGSTIDADTAVTGTSSLAKKQPVTLEKEVNTAATGYSDVTDPADQKKGVAVGDTVPFIVTTVTPNYGTNYTNPVFTLTDTLSEGLEMTEDQQAKIVVKNGSAVLSAKENEQDTEYDYEITTSESGYEISFSTAYLTNIKANTSVTVEYTATVNAKAVMHQVERYTNDVQLEFSNSPETTNDSLKDKTNHYTFSIDASIAGQTSGEGSKITRELVKVGVDAEGHVLTQWVTDDEESWEWESGVEALPGATFTLTRDDGKVYEATSDENGFISFTGLDAASYELVETSAPAGYKFSTTGIPVVITAEYWAGKENQGDHADDELYSYSITINNTATSTYTTTNTGEHEVTAQEVEEDNNITFPINNVKGVTLPSTGGIGTTIFYVVGGILVLAAVIFLVTKRRMSSND